MRTLTLGTVIKYTMITLFVGALLGYGYHAVNPFLAGPSLTLITPEDNAHLEKPLIEVRGSVQNLSHLYLNGRSITMTQEGTFAEELLLVPGYNTVELTGTDRFGREITTRRQIVYTEQETTITHTTSSPLAGTIHTINSQ
ncbi:MAG: hypothetical protein WDZ70_00600 [Candidatus Paceibacterota bacterium]